MRLTVVGCSGSGPGPEGPASCYLVEHDGFRLVLDLGNGALGALRRYADPRTVDAIVLSHLHSDHCLDTCALIVLHRFHPGPRPSPIPLYGPPGTTERILAAGDPGGHDLSDVFTVTDLRAGNRRLGPFELTWVRTNHPLETYAVRIAVGGRRLTYSADTGACPALVELTRGSDLLLCEASFQEPGPGQPANPSNLHLSGRGAAEHAVAAGVGRLLLTHIPLWQDPTRTLAEARAVFDRCELVHSGSAYEL